MSDFNSADYLTQLLKDKKQLAAFPNVFMHLERLLDEGKPKISIAHQNKPRLTFMFFSSIDSFVQHLAHFYGTLTIRLFRKVPFTTFICLLA